MTKKAESHVGGVIKKMALGGTVALACAGLTTCNMGAVDPTRQPLDCKADAGGIPLTVTGVASGGLLQVTVDAVTNYSQWLSFAVTDVQGATLKDTSSSGSPSGSPDYFIDLILPDVPDGGTRPMPGHFIGHFTVQALLLGYGSVTCQVKHTFQFTVDISGVEPVKIARRALPPREARHAAAIALITRQEDEERLRAQSRHPGEPPVSWRVSAGHTATNGELLRWRRLPNPGLYQVELGIDRDHDGLAFDIMTFGVA